VSRRLFLCFYYCRSQRRNKKKIIAVHGLSEEDPKASQLHTNESDKKLTVYDEKRLR
jgi:hypothetical protein